MEDNDEKEKKGMTDQLMIRLYPKEREVVERLVNTSTIDDLFKKYESISHFCRVAIIALVQKEGFKVDKSKKDDEKENKVVSCFNCKVPFGKDSKKHKFKNGLVCNGCFLTAGKEELNRWDE